MKSWPRQTGQRSGVALVIVLSFVVLLTVVVVAYFARVLNSRQLANDSLNSAKTDQLTRNALEVIVNDFKQEIVNGSTATTIPAPPSTNGVTTYYPSARANMVPVRSGTTDAIPNLIRRSVRSDAMAAPGVGSRASAVNSTTDPAGNGRIISRARWNEHYLIPQADPAGSKPDPAAVFTAPDWVMMTREEGPAVLSTPTLDANGKTVTPIGRYAYAVYDEGGLLDANVAGFPSGTIPGQYGGKGVLALADLTQLPIKPNPAPSPSSDYLSTNVIDQLVGWRNYGSAKPAGTFGNFSFDAASATRYYNASITDNSGFLKTSANVFQNRTDQKFLSRGQLLAFQQSFPASVFPASVLQYLGTFSRELNAPSWGPTQNASDMGGNSDNMTTVTPNAVNPPPASVAYYTNRNSDTAVNRSLPGVRFTNAGTVTGYDATAQPYQYTVKTGDLLVQRRFPLNRLTWIGPKGPRNGGTAASIQACFGLVWGPANETKLNASNPTGPVYVWKYCGPTGTTEQGIPEKLAQVAAESAPREPNFFELLQAGMLTGSLALLPSELGGYTPTFTLDSDQWTELQLFRIGATMITQSQQTDGTTITANYPTTIEFAHNGLPFVVAGVDDLPYLNTFYTVSGSPSLTTKIPLEVFMVFGLWNPHQSSGTVARPNIRLVMEGSVTMANRYGDTRDTTPGHYSDTSVTVYNFSSPGYIYNLSATTTPLLLANTAGSAVGVNGFADPHVLTAQDVQSPLNATSTGLAWGTTTPIGGNTYVGYRLPDFLIDPTKNPGPKDSTYTANPYLWSWMYFYFNTAANHPFNAWLEFQNPDGFWIPYNYFAGVNHIDPGIAKTPGFFSSYMGPDNMGSVVAGGYATGTTAVPMPIDDAADTGLYCLKYPMTNSDPRSARFNYATTQTATSRPNGFLFFNSSIWSAQTENATVPGTLGRKMSAGAPAVPFTGGSYYGSALCRNNSVAATTYKDLDGVQRIGDSGLYTDLASGNGWQGDPYALANTTNVDRPVVFHRPYTNVAELGYIPRDYPWRTLDFFTAQSADAGLLDLFTASPGTGPVSAGRVNLNTRNTPVLTALLSRAGTNFVTGATPTTLTRPASIAAKLVTLTTSTAATDGPMINRSEIVNRFVGAKLSTAPIAATSDFSSLDEQNIKVRREAVTRSLAEVGQTRTWNLLVDVVVQSGRYPTNATQLTQFNVEGERHCWFHVAIDRFTGEVIDQQLEPVSE